MKALIFLLLFSGQQSQVSSLSTSITDTRQEIITLHIRDKRADCDGLNGRTQCYQVQKGENIGSDEWEIIPGEIENFRYEEGYQYDISVEMTLQPNAEDEKSRYTYKLKEVLSKTKI